MRIAVMATAVAAVAACLGVVPGVRAAAQTAPSADPPAAGTPAAADGVSGTSAIVVQPLLPLALVPAVGIGASAGAARESPPPLPGGASRLLPEGAPIGDYDRAFAVLRLADYGQAAVLLQRFVQTYPSDPLTANALYWLGEVRMIRGEYAGAAAAFADAVRSQPVGAKAEEARVKLAIALGRDGRREEACGVFERLARDHPTADARLGVTLVAERRRLGC